MKKIKPMVRLTKEQIQQKQDQIERYIQSVNPADGSLVDSNANVSVKTVATLGAELQKDFSIQLNRKTVADYIQIYFDKNLANKYLEYLESHVLYKHDEASIAPGMPYTYGADESVFCIYKNRPLIVSFEQLYSICEEEEKCVDEEKGVWIKIPEELTVADKGGFTKVTQLTKKNRHRDMVYVKTERGEDLLVTDNHPLIIDDEETVKDAIDCSNEFQKSLSFDYKIKETISFNTAEFIPETEFFESFDSHVQYKKSKNKPWCGFPKKINLDKDFGYFVGYFIGDGFYRGKKLSFISKDEDTIKRLSSFAYKTFGINSALGMNGNCYVTTISSEALYNIFKNYFKIGEYALHKSLPINILETNNDFINGVISGIIDSDGSVLTNNTASIRVISRCLIEQLSMLFTVLGVDYSVRKQKKSSSKNSFSSNYDIFEIKFDSLRFNHSFTKDMIERTTRWNYNWGIQAKKNEWKKIIVCEKYDGKYVDEMNFIYDISTETHTFICNGLLVHNCVAINMYPFIEDGMLKLGGESKAPKHLESFCGSFVNLIFAISSQFAGAVAAVEFLLYFHYFAEKDYGKDYLDTHKDLIKQKLQGVIYCLNQPAAARGYQSVFFNMSVFDRYFFDSMFGHFMFPDGTIVNYDDFNKLQKFFMEWLLEERSKSLLTFPVLTEASLNENGKPKDTEWAEFCADIRARGLSFFSFNDDTPSALASCCRLKNELDENDFSYSLGAGGVSTGSTSVMTLNVNRMVQDILKDYSGTYEEKKNLVYTKLRDYITDIQKFQVAHRHIVEDYVRAGLLTAYSAGFISLDKQFVTIGINGLNEAAEFLGLTVSNNEDYLNFVAGFLNVIKTLNKEAKAKYHIKFNTELVPAENLGVKNAHWDIADHYKVNRKCYNSYIYLPEDDKTSIPDKFKMHGGIIADSLDGE